MVLVITLLSCSGKAQPAAPQKITISNFKVYEKDTKQVVEWNTATGDETNTWQVQCSTDGTTFTTVAIVLGDDPKQPGHYRYAEKIKQGSSLKKYYRLCHIGIDGSNELSEIIQPAK